MKRLLCTLVSLFLCFLCLGADGFGLRTVVIDPGHGGKDPGAVSQDGRTYEKTFTLEISKKLAEMIRAKYPDVNVVLTRESDKQVTLDRRAEIANKADADLFISVHINASTSRASNGYSVHVLGESSQANRDLYAYNLEICKRENAVISLEDGFATTSGFDPNNPESYIFMTMMQSAYLEQSIYFAQLALSKLRANSPFSTNHGVNQNPFYVLWKTSMPSVLVELGYISNADDLSLLKKRETVETLASCLLDAFSVYKEHYDASMNVASKPQSKPAPKQETPAPEKTVVTSAAPAAAPAKTPTPAEAAVVPKTAVQYGVQAFAVSRELPKGDSRLLGFEPKIVKEGNLFKYILAVGPDPDFASKNLSKIREKYPDAYLVKVDDGTVKRFSISK